MAELRKDGPYVWATWLPKLLAGYDSCEWAIWFKAHHTGSSWIHKPSNLSEWLIKHTEMLRQRSQQLTDDGYDVSVEDQNRFSLTGSQVSVVIQGKPDIIAVKDGVASVIDVKAGQPQGFHDYQVMLYMYALSRGKYNATQIKGQLVYPTHETEVPFSRVNDEFIQTLGGLVRRIASPSPPLPRVPSARECGWCDITGEDCPDIIEGGPIEIVADAF